MGSGDPSGLQNRRELALLALVSSTLTRFRQLCFPAKPAGRPRLAACPGGKVGLMAGAANPESFEEIVEWAYSTLPKKIRDLRDFPDI